MSRTHSHHRSHRGNVMRHSSTRRWPPGRAAASSAWSWFDLLIKAECETRSLAKTWVQVFGDGKERLGCSLVIRIGCIRLASRLGSEKFSDTRIARRNSAGKITEFGLILLDTWAWALRGDDRGKRLLSTSHSLILFELFTFQNYLDNLICLFNSALSILQFRCYTFNSISWALGSCVLKLMRSRWRVSLIAVDYLQRICELF